MLSRAARSERGLYERVTARRTTLLDASGARLNEHGLFNTGRDAIRKGACIGLVRGTWVGVDVHTPYKGNGFVWQSSQTRVDCHTIDPPITSPM